MAQLRSDADVMKFNLKYRPTADLGCAGEHLWGRWLDRKRGHVLAMNNAFEVPLVINDTVRVKKHKDGYLRVRDVVRVTESPVTWTSFEHPVTPREAQAFYDGLVTDGHAIHSEGNHYGVMVTAWREMMTLEKVLSVLTPTFLNPGWTLWQLFTPEERLQKIRDQIIRLP